MILAALDVFCCFMENKAVTYEGEQRVRKRERGYRTRGEEGQDQNVPMKENSASEIFYLGNFIKECQKTQYNY